MSFRFTIFPPDLLNILTDWETLPDFHCQSIADLVEPFRKILIGSMPDFTVEHFFCFGGKAMPRSGTVLTFEHFL